jgi:subtilisin family serine protease
MLSRLVGPGRIMVASAGNQGRKRSWFLKPVGDGTMGTFLRAHEPEMMVTLKAAADFDFRLVGYTGHGDTLTINSQQVCLQEDSVLTTTFLQDDQLLAISIEAYPSCYDSAETCYDLLLLGKNSVGSTPRLALEVLSSGSDVEVYRVSGLFNTYDNNPLLTAGECTHNVLSPSTAPCVISVGGTIYRQGITNYQGKWITGEAGSGGERGTYSSVGPTMDGRIKPDVMAPGANIISSWSSFYLENHPDENDRTWDVAYFDFDGRTYAWQASGGTSMSAPAVAGAIALWLQAKPDLTPDEVLGVLSRTARHPDETLSYPNNYYGYGEIDVYRGLLDILGADAIEELSQHPSKARMTVADGRLSLLLEQPSEHPLRLRVFSLSGRLLTDVRVPARQTTPAVSLAGLPAGVYAVQVDGDDALTGSSLIRWP